MRFLFFRVSASHERKREGYAGDISSLTQNAIYDTFLKYYRLISAVISVFDITLFNKIKSKVTNFV